MAILHLHDQAYPAAVGREIEGRTGRRPVRGAVYVTLDRLEAKGLVTSGLEAEGTGRPGRARRSTRVTRPACARCGARSTHSTACGPAWSRSSRRRSPT
jgi:hypothetical protein